MPVSEPWSSLMNPLPGCSLFDWLMVALVAAPVIAQFVHYVRVDAFGLKD